MISWLTDSIILLTSDTRVFIFQISVFIITGLINSVNDLIRKEVFPFFILAASGIILTADFFLIKGFFIYQAVGMILTGGIFLVIYRLSGGGVGLGDLLFLLFIMTVFGLPAGLVVFIGGYWLATLFIIVPLLTGRLDRKSKIPMIPFFTLAGIIAIFILFYLKKSGFFLSNVL
jgi:hypothetical protein